ncbi:MAG: DivIVA domain-containing protein [Candidatus Nanopelagicales bacterium]
MTLVFVALGVVLLAAIGMIAAGRLGQLDSPTRDRPPAPLLPADPTPLAVQEVRFTIAARGYRMAEVDSTLRTLTAALADRDAQIAQLRGGHPAADDAQPFTPPSPSVTDAGEVPL